MRSRLFITLAVALALVMLATMLTFSQATQQPAAGAGGAAAQGGRGGATAPPLPTPKNADGTTNFGRVPGEKGTWSLPYITNMGARNVVIGAPPAPPPAAPAPAAAGARGAAPAAPAPGAGLRGGAAAEPWVPFQTWSAGVYDYHSLNQSKYDPEGLCLPPGGPRMYATPYPMEIIQQPEHKRVIMIFEGGTHVWREIYMDGREHPHDRSFDGSHMWLGHSVGHYENNGQTLVVDVVGFNEGTWIDYFGHPHTEQLHVVEKFSRPNKNQLHFEALIDDPGAYTKPWSVQWNIPWNQNGELLEYVCQGNNQYLNHLKDDYGQPIIVRQQ